jgi:hypothetical protein
MRNCAMFHALGHTSAVFRHLPRHACPSLQRGVKWHSERHKTKHEKTLGISFNPGIAAMRLMLQRRQLIMLSKTKASETPCEFARL